jgi:hypothetical protein
MVTSLDFKNVHINFLSNQMISHGLNTGGSQAD